MDVGKFTVAIVDHAYHFIETSAQGEEVRPLDFSITKNVFALMINSSILVIILLLCARWYRNKGTTEANPKGFVAAIEMFIMSIVDGIIKPCVGKNYKRYTPYQIGRAHV